MKNSVQLTEKQSVVVRHSQCVFTKAQIEEQEKFKVDLENGNVKFAFSGTFAEGLSFLKETGELVDAINHN